MKKQFSFILLFFVAITSFSQTKVSVEDAAKHIGETVTVAGKVFDGKYLDRSNTKPTLLNMGAAYPNHTFTVVIEDSNRTKFSYKPEEFLINKNILVTGKISDHNGKPQIIISGPGEIKVDNESAIKDTSAYSNASGR